MTELKLPQITNTQHDLIVDDSFTTFNNLLKHFNLPNYNASSSLKQKIEFLIASLENEQVRNKLEHKVMDLTGMIEDYENYREMEIEADTYEVKLERLKYKYHDIIEKQIDLEKLKKENIRLENELKTADSQNKLAYCKEFLDNLNDSVDINEVRKFGSLLSSDMIMHRVSEMRAKKNIQALPRNIISTFCLKLLKYRKISLEKYSETMCVEKNILQKIAFKLAFDGIAVYDGNDIIKIE